MSGLLQEVGTPCPRRSRGSRTSNESGSGSDPFDSLWDDSTGDYDDTRNVDFTTEIKHPILTATKPRRRTKTASFTIHGDHEQPAATAKPKREIKPALATTRKSSLLQQPAQRFRPRVSFAPSPLKHSRERDELEPTKRNMKPDVQQNNDLLKQISGEGDGALVKDVLKKEVRRDTVYVSTEDTTVASVFMGIFSPLKSNPEKLISEDTEIGTLEARIARNRKARKTPATSPGRAPLQLSSKLAQDTCNKIDVPGKNGGKENIPPGMEVIEVKNKKSITPTKPFNDDFIVSKLNGSVPTGDGVKRPLAVRTANKSVKRIESQPTLKATMRNTAGRQPLNTRTVNPALKRSTASNPLRVSKLTMNISNGKSLRDLNREYSMASKNITNPAMYDDDWLSHQEVILTQLINGLFGQTNNGAVEDPAMLRHDLLQLYQGPYFTTLHKRLQASLLYGALSIPKDALLKNSRLRQDLGMKRRFIDIWLNTYEPNILRAALEAVTGRMIPDKTSSSNLQEFANESALPKKPTAKRLAKFLDAFLIQNQDIEQNGESGTNDHDVLLDAYRRTALRSIMMVILLDEAKKSCKAYSSRCLFLASSPYKTSSAVLQALARFLLPSCGDVGKAVSQIDVRLTYEQLPLEEYNYEITNLAVDLRDGVRLTRLVELLLYPSSNRAQTAFVANSNGQWPLSRKLKFPCLGRAVKMFNVKTALDALTLTKEGRQLVSSVCSADIVNGHREKTIAILWGLFSNWGLHGLIDMNELRAEINRLRKRLATDTAVDLASHELDKSDEPDALLRKWAATVGQLRGLRSGDLNMNLANSQVYECILDEYEGYILEPTQDSMSSGNTTLESRLRALGCSAQFINLISPSSKSRILDNSSTIGALAYLCSRLLPATKRTRAATILQNAWRRVLDRRLEKKRAMARDVARQCAAVVQTRNRILWAKNTIVHWWRACRAQRLKARGMRRCTITTTKLSRTKSTGALKSRIPARKSMKITLHRGLNQL
ncbi:putative calmodulin-binding protein Sha1 [Aspergillus stella-maris]|uniref:putative calmodulin-binding protein Sha1 n=1 Tax=Aspergillus stella-maris TaxID=1810926 RepID=UPI003CCC9130